jgi:hypothetical protein
MQKALLRQKINFGVMMSKIKIFFILLIAAILAACTSIESDLKSFLKCGMAAHQLQKPVAARNISIKMEQYLKGKNINVPVPARDAMYLGEEVRDELALHEKTIEGQLYTLVKVYNSSKCREMHEQDKIKMPFMYYLTYIFI